MISDCHMHTSFSSDSTASMESMVERAVALGLPSICLTDHFDMDYAGGEFWLDTPAYAGKVQEMKEKYEGRIRIAFGVELGLQPYLSERLTAYVKSWPFDSVIGSVHVLDGKDPYYREEFRELTDEELYRKYFLEVAENIRNFHDFQTLGHLDYIVRYGNTKAEQYSYRKYQEEIDAVLRELIHYDIALEINTGGVKAGLGFPNPHPDIIRRYRELGGEKIAFGADAHSPEYIAYAFPEAKEAALSAGFRYYCRFWERKPEFVKIG